MTSRRIGVREETYRLGHLKLYRDELEQIAKVVNEVGELVIRCGDWEMTDPADFTNNAELPEVLPALTMVASRTAGKTAVTAGHEWPTVQVTLSLTEASVTLTQPDTHTLGVLSRIQQVSREGRRWGPGVVLVQVLAAIVIAAFTSKSIRTARPLTASRAVLINAYRADRPSFWRRSRDDWIIGAVMLLLGGVLGYFVNVIT